MTKAKLLIHLKTLYRAGNSADNEQAPKQLQAFPQLAGEALCQPIDQALSRMVAIGFLTEAERQTFYDTM